MNIEQTKVIRDEILEQRIADLNFIKIKIDVDEDIAKLRYLNDYNNNINGIKNCNLSYNQWLIEYKLEAIKLYMDLL